MSTREKPTVEALLTVDETAAFLNVSRAQIYLLVREGVLRPLRVGTRMRFAPEELREYAARER